MTVSAGATGAAATVAPLRQLLTTGPSHCLMYRAWGIRCPLCGMTRASVALLRGHLVDALRYNALALPYVAFLGWALITVVILGRPLRPPRFGGVIPVGLQVIAAVSMLVAFTVVRWVV